MIASIKTEPTEPESGSKPVESKQHEAHTEFPDAYAELEKSMYTALETYSNVHRGSGHYSMVTTHLYERAREIVLEYLNLQKNKFMVIFCSPRRAYAFVKCLEPGSFQIIRSSEFGLNLGLAAIAIRKKSLVTGIPFESGGGTTKLYGADWVIWAKKPDMFEAGTPAIINVVGFAKALKMIRQKGNEIFMNEHERNSTVRQIIHDDELASYSGMELLAKLRETLIGKDVLVPTTNGLQPFINFDSSASTQTFEPVWNAFIKAYRQPENGCKEIVNEVKQICAATVGVPQSEYETIFTSSTTESINLVAQSLENEPNEGIEPVILTTVLEHSSNDLPWRTVKGHTILRLAVDNDGFLNPEQLETLLNSYNIEHQHGNKRIKLIAVSGASNVLGSCNDLKAIGDIAKRFRARLLVDGAQLVAHRQIDMQSAGIDYLAFSAHKVYAPFGTGVLIARKGLLHLNSHQYELITSSALENAGGIAALGKALVLMNRIGFNIIEAEEHKMMVKALNEMAQITGVKLHGADPEKLTSPLSRTGVIGFELKNKMPARIAGKLARRGAIGVRFGCHCTHLIVKQLSGFTPFQEKFQRLIVKMIPMLNLQGFTRVSISIQNTEADVDILIEELRGIAGNGKGNNKNIPPANNARSVTQVSDDVVKKQIKDFIKSRENLVYG